MSKTVVHRVYAPAHQLSPLAHGHVLARCSHHLTGRIGTISVGTIRRPPPAVHSHCRLMRGGSRC